MYSARIIDQRIALAESALRQDATLPPHLRGLKLERHSIADVDAFEAHLRRHQRYTYNSSGMPVATKNLTIEEAAWMLNEQVLVKCDALYALTRYCFVKSEEARVEHFAPRVAQRILFDLIAELEDRQVSIEIMILKARQLGATTFVQLLIALRIFFGYGVNAVAASAEKEKSALMANKLFIAYDMMPVWLRPQYSQRSESDTPRMAFGALNTLFSVQHGNKMKGGIAQGWDPTIYHISEVALMAEPEIQIDEGLHKAVHKSPAVMGFLESTGAGDTGWWADTWRYSKQNWPNCRLYPQFLPWACGIEIYPMVADMLQSPIPPDWLRNRLPDTVEHVAKVEAYVASQPRITRHLCCEHPDLPGKESWWANGRMPIEQQWYWEMSHEEAKAKGKEANWYQAMAGDDIEALQRSAGSAVFSDDLLHAVDVAREPSCRVYGISGQSIEANHEPDAADIDYAADSDGRLIIQHRSLRGETYRWELPRLLHDDARVDQLRRTNLDAFNAYSYGKLFVWEPPRPGVLYSIGGDTSNGIGQDSTSFSVTAVGSGDLPDRQVAEFRSPFVSHVEAYAFCMLIACYYAQPCDGNLALYPKIGIEQLRAVGDTCQLQMRKMGYPVSRFHGMVRYDSRQIKKSSSPKLGWYTTPWSRPMLLGNFIHVLQNSWYQLNSPWTLEECRRFEVHYTATGRPKPEHQAGYTDDSLFAAAISTFIAHDTGVMAERTKKRFLGIDPRQLPTIDLAPSSGLLVPTLQATIEKRMVSMTDVLYS